MPRGARASSKIDAEKMGRWGKESSMPKRNKTKDNRNRMRTGKKKR